MDDDDILAFLVHTEHLLENDTNIEAKVKTALLQRLGFRRLLFLAITTSSDRQRPEIMNLRWSAAEKLLPALSAAHNLAVAVPEAFSTKIQRSIASTTAPKPSIKLCFDKTIDFFGDLCRHGEGASGLLSCHSIVVSYL